MRLNINDPAYTLTRESKIIYKPTPSEKISVLIPVSSILINAHPDLLLMSLGSYQKTIKVILKVILRLTSYFRQKLCPLFRVNHCVENIDTIRV